MPSFPLYFEAKEKELQSVTVELTDEQQKQRCQDQEVVNAMDDYYEPHRARWRASGALLNLIQTGTDDVVSNWYLGWARILLNHFVASCSDGMPEGDFQPVGPSDYKKRILWNALVKHALNKCNWQAHQRQWLWDVAGFGNATIKNYSELPMRKRRFQKEDGTWEEKFVRDFRRAKVGIRTRSPFRTMRSTLITDPDAVNVGVEREQMSWNEASIRYGNAILPDGTKKYDTDGVPRGSHVQITHIYDELADEQRDYWLSFGGRPEDTYQDCPKRELGHPIYNKPLSRYKFASGGKQIIGGANPMGMAPLSFGIFDDQLDGDFETHAVCGMGIPQIIEGPEAIMQALANMTIDNVRLKNSVPISFTPNSKESPSFMSLDPRTMYSGLLIDGQVQASPLGVADVASNSVMWDWLKTLMYQLTGISVEQLSGDNMKTAFQSGLIVRQMNMRTKARIRGWEQGPFKRAWTILLADCLTSYTQTEWEAITEEDAKRIADRIGKDEMTGEDYDDGTKVEPKGEKKRRVMFYFPVEGRKFREDFTGKNKKRTLDPNSTQNTLIEDKNAEGVSSLVPADPAYIGDVEQAIEYDTKVDGASMLVDLQMQDIATWKEIRDSAIAMKALVPDIDLRKIFVEIAKVAGKEEKDVMMTEGEHSQVQKDFKALADDVSSTSPTPNAQGNLPMALPAVQPAGEGANAGQPPNQPGGPAGTQELLGRVAGGLV